MKRSIIVSEQPSLIIRDYAPDAEAEETLRSIEVMDGLVSVDLRRADQIGKKAAFYAVLASTGMSNDEIGQVADRSPLTIKSHMQTMLHSMNWRNRASIAGWMFETGIYTVEQPITPLDLSFREEQVLGLVADGFQNKQIGNQLYISTHTVKSHMQRIADTVGFGSREALALATHVSRNQAVEAPAA